MSKLTPREILTASPVVPVMAIDDLSTAVDLAHALVAGGIRTLEITLRTPAGLDAIRLIKKEVKGAIVGAGTVINEKQLKAVADAGAAFAISPGLHKALAKAGDKANIPLIPGVATPSAAGVGIRHGNAQTVPCRGGGRHSHAQSPVWPVCQRALLPHGRHHAAIRARIFGAAQRVVRGRLVAHAQGCRCQQRLGYDYSVSQRSGGVERVKAA